MSGGPAQPAKGPVDLSSAERAEPRRSGDPAQPAGRPVDGPSRERAEPRTSDLERFPHPVYAETVLAPLFDRVRARFADHMDAVDRAHLVMLRETGILGAGDAAAIAGALGEIAAAPRDGLRYTGEHEDWFFLVEHELRSRLGDLGGRLHTARSRNDIDHTVFEMALRERADDLAGRLLGLAGTLTAKARAEQATLVVAYTHGQPAQPTTWGHDLGAVVEALLRDVARLDAATDALDLCNHLGGDDHDYEVADRPAARSRSCWASASSHDSTPTSCFPSVD